jgi:release factor glutamine methyltransferase
VSAVTKAGAEMTLRELHHVAVARLQAAGVKTPEIDARILLRLAFGFDEAALVSASQMPIPEERKARFDRLMERRMAGEPVARIKGRKEFWSHSFRLGADTLVPRPETETLVEAALEIFPKFDAKLRVLDLGTGSGILLGAISLERENATGVGIDRSEAALQIARENLNGLGVGDRVRFVCGDWAAAIDTALGQKFDLVVANPPYIESKEIAALAREVREHDPHLALDGGADGFDCYRQIIAELPHLLSDDGAAGLELGIGQEAGVANLAGAKGLVVAGPARRDLAGIPRALILYRGTRK